MRVRLFAAGLLLAAAVPAFAQAQGQQTPNQQPAQDPDKPVTFEEQVVVTASRSEEQLVNAPAAVSRDHHGHHRELAGHQHR